MLWSSAALPIVIAHRGASAHAPENTLAAFELAVQHGAFAIELDAKLSADGQVIVFHDATLDRTTNAQGKVNKCSLAALRELDAGSFFAPQFAGEKIPTLDEVFEAVGQRLMINIELTNYATPRDALVEKTAALVKRHGLEQRVWFSSFFSRNVKVAQQLLPESARGLLAWSGVLGVWSRRVGFNQAAYQAVHPYIREASAGLIQRAHTRGKKVFVWTVNQPDDMRRLQSLGVDGIFTDDPKLAVRVFESA